MWVSSESLTDKACSSKMPATLAMVSAGADKKIMFVVIAVRLGSASVDVGGDNTAGAFDSLVVSAGFRRLHRFVGAVLFGSARGLRRLVGAALVGPVTIHY